MQLNTLYILYKDYHNQIFNNRRFSGNFHVYSEKLTSSLEWEMICSVNYNNNNNLHTLITIGPVKSWWAFFHAFSISRITDGTRRTVASVLASFSPTIWRTFRFTFRAGEAHFTFTFSCLENNEILQCLSRSNRITKQFSKRKYPK